MISVLFSLIAFKQFGAKILEGCLGCLFLGTRQAKVSNSLLGKPDIEPKLIRRFGQCLTCMGIKAKEERGKLHSAYLLVFPEIPFSKLARPNPSRVFLYRLNGRIPIVGKCLFGNLRVVIDGMESGD